MVGVLGMSIRLAPVTRESNLDHELKLTLPGETQAVECQSKSSFTVNLKIETFISHSPNFFNSSR